MYCKIIMSGLKDIEKAHHPLKIILKKYKLRAMEKLYCLGYKQYRKIEQ